MEQINTPTNTQIARNAISSDLQVNIQGKIPLKEIWETCEISFHILQTRKTAMYTVMALENTA